MEAMNAKKQRPRGKNWHFGEIEVLINAVQQRWRILNSSFSTSVSNKDKVKAWQEVADKVNANSETFRTLKEVKKKFGDFKSETKKNNSLIGREVRKTGGGVPKKVTLNPLQEKMLSLMPSCQLVGCEEGLDSEAPMLEDADAEPSQGICPVADDQPQPQGALSPSLFSSLPSPSSSPIIQQRQIVPVAKTVGQTAQKTVQVVDVAVERRRKTPSKSAPQAISSYQAQIMELETNKLGVLKEMLQVEKERLAVERRRLDLEEERMQIIRRRQAPETAEPLWGSYSVSPEIKFN